MLAPGDRELAERDRAIPGLATLLDPDAFADALRSYLPRVPITCAQARYARYKPGLSCLVAFVVDAGEVRLDVHAKAYGPSAADKLGNAACRMRNPSSLGPGGLVREDIGAAFYFFPNDITMRAMPSIADPRTRERLLEATVPSRSDLWDAVLQPLHYKPGRRYVARLTGQNGGAVLRAYSESDYDCAVRAADSFTQQRSLRVSRPLGANRKSRCLVLEWLDGEPLDQRLGDPEFDLSRLQDVGAAVAELHSQVARPLRQSAPADRSHLPLLAAVDIGSVCPDLASRAARLGQELTRKLLGTCDERRPIHGDFSADQVLLCEDGIGLIDLDAATMGDPIDDIGSFAAHLERDVARGNLPVDRARLATASLLDGYRHATGYLPPKAFALHFAAALLRMAYSPFRYREPEWPRLANTLVRRAEEVGSDA
jgi:aminoglycoside phosphotransferase (APT) family kinase protein